ncbi:MlaD family protein [Coralliovum pocilloporae]|uniref:MlaD family protein n=1 Tax=Coralliovum pocilloporae TaxID=3066369 RepID=UPI0033073AB6
METRANYVLIGFFTLAVLLLGVGLTLWIARYDDGAEKSRLTVVFPGTVTGLGEGANVLFNGIKVGSVESLSLDPNDPGRVIGQLLLDPNTPVKGDTRASLAFQGLTGVALVELEGGTATKPNILRQEGTPQLTAEPSAFQDILQAGRRLVQRADTVLLKIEKVLDDNSPSFNQTIKNAEVFTEALAKNSEGVDRFLSSVSSAADQVGSLAQRLEVVSANLDPILEAIQPEKVRNTINNVEAFSVRLSEASENFQSIVDKAETAASQFSTFSSGLNVTLESVQTIVAALDSEQIRQTIENANTFTAGLVKSGEDLSAFAKILSESGDQIDTILADAQAAAGNVKDFTQTLSDNRDNINAIVADAKTLAQRLNAASLRINGVLDKVDGVVGDLSEQGLFAEIQQAAKSIRKIAESFEGRADAIANGLARFSTRGLRDVEALVGDARVTLRRIEGVVKKIETEPDSLLFGGSKVKEYNGRRF